MHKLGYKDIMKDWRDYEYIAGDTTHHSCNILPNVLHLDAF